MKVENGNIRENFLSAEMFYFSDKWPYRHQCTDSTLQVRYNIMLIRYTVNLYNVSILGLITLTTNAPGYSFTLS